MGTKRVVLGNLGLETTVSLQALPLENASSHKPYALELGVSGVGFNLARALQVLGTDVRLASILAPDRVGRFVLGELEAVGLAESWLHLCNRTARSLVLSDEGGTRHVHTDLGGVSDALYPPERFDAALVGMDLALLTNIPYARPLLARALVAGIPISTDLHAIRHLDNPYDQPFLEAATLLFLSGKYLEDALQTVRALWERFNPEIVVVGLGADGALLSERSRDVLHVPAYPATRIAGTVGAGDALHAAFCHFWLQGEPPLRAAELACRFAALKLRVAGGGQGFVSEAVVRSLA